MASDLLDLDAILARCDAARPGPWRVSDPINRAKHNYIMVDCYCAEEDKQGGDDPWGWLADLANQSFGRADAEFIAHARQDVPALLARITECLAYLNDSIDHAERTRPADLWMKGRLREARRLLEHGDRG